MLIEKIQQDFEYIDKYLLLKDLEYAETCWNAVQKLHKCRTNKDLKEQQIKIAKDLGSINYESYYGDYQAILDKTTTGFKHKQQLRHDKIIDLLRSYKVLEIQKTFSGTLPDGFLGYYQFLTSEGIKVLTICLDIKTKNKRLVVQETIKLS